MEPAVWSALILAGFAFAASVLQNIQNRNAAKETARLTQSSQAATNSLSQRVVDRDDFKEIMERKDAEQKRTDDRLEDLEKRLEKAENARQEAEEEARVANLRMVEAEERAAAAEERADKLETRVAKLEQTLLDHNIPIPDY